MTDDEISEFAEALEWACQVSELPIGDDGAQRDADECNCPIGALVPDAPTWPTAHLVADVTGLEKDDIFSFMCGYDGAGRATDPRLYDLGCQFRERYP